MILPELPDYLESLGGKDYKGAIIGLFTLTACISRPFSGRLSDTVGRVPIIMFGTLMAVLANSLYIFVPFVAGFLFLRLLHGLTVGFTATGSTAYISDVVPLEKRGEAMGFFGLMNNVGAGIAPLFGSFIVKKAGITEMFITAGLLAVGSALIFYNIKETLPEKQKFNIKLLNLRKQDLAERRVWLPALIMTLMVFSFGTVLTVGFDLAKSLHASNKGSILMIMTLSSVLIRVVAGRFSDRYGRKTTMLIGLITLSGGLILMANAHTLTSLFIGTAIVGMANGMNNPTIFAWVTDWSHPSNKGRAISTLFIALEAGIGMGALISGAIYKNKMENIAYPFYLAAALTIVATIILSATWKYKPKLILE